MTGRGRGGRAGDDYARRVRAALERLGPVFSAFGIYLSSRADLLSLQDCLELSGLADRAEATPGALVRALVAGETGVEAGELHLEAEPFESRLLSQSHSAWLADGRPFTVRVTHPGVEETLDADAKGLRSLVGMFGDGPWGGLPLGNAVEDFLLTLDRQTDLLHEAGAMETLAQDAREFDLLWAPSVHRPFCTSRVLAVGRPSGWRLDEVLASPGGGGGAAPDTPPGDLARALCFVWLRQALQGRLFPVDARPENITVLPGRRIAFACGDYEFLSADARAGLTDYLMATAAHDPDRACACLLREMERGGRASDEGEVQQRFRQIVPFRDGGWDAFGECDSLAEHLCVQWRTVRSHGYRPRPHLLRFCRGLFLVAVIARRLAPERDALAESLNDLRTMTGVAQLRDMTSPDRWEDSLDKYAEAALELPKRLDEALTLATRSVWSGPQPSAPVPPPRNTPALAVALSLLMASVVLWSRYIVGKSGGVWVERAGAAAFVLLGVVLIWTICRRR